VVNALGKRVTNGTETEICLPAGEHHLLIALAHHGLGDPAKARHHLDQTLAFTLTDQRAADLLHAMERQLP